MKQWVNFTERLHDKILSIFPSTVQAKNNQNILVENFC